MKTTVNKNGNLATAEKWWNETDFLQMELVTRFRQYEFNPEDGYQEFVDACDEYWNNLSKEKKSVSGKKTIKLNSHVSDYFTTDTSIPQSGNQ